MMGDRLKPFIHIAIAVFAWLGSGLLLPSTAEFLGIPTEIQTYEGTNTTTLGMYLFILSIAFGCYVYAALNEHSLKVHIHRSGRSFIPLALYAYTFYTILVTILEMWIPRYLDQYEIPWSIIKIVMGFALFIWVFDTHRNLDKNEDSDEPDSLQNTQDVSTVSKEVFRVLVDDHFNYMDDDASYEDSRHATMAQAEQRCFEIIENFLGDNYRTSTPKEIISTWFQFGPDPYCKGSSFSASNYLRERAFEIGRTGLPSLPSGSIDFSQRPILVERYEPDQFVIRESKHPIFRELVITSTLPNPILEISIDSAFINWANAKDQSDMLVAIYNILKDEGWEIELVQ